MKLILLLLSFSPVNEQMDYKTVTLSCSVLKYEHCQHTVEWLYEGNWDDFKDLKKSKGSCLATVSFTTSNLNQKSNYYELFRCKVTEINNRTLLCNLNKSSCEKQGKFVDFRWI